MVIFVMMVFPFLGASVTYAFGGPFRRPVWTNRFLVACVIVFFTVLSSVVLTGPNPLTAWFHSPANPYNSVLTESDVWRTYQEKICVERYGSTTPLDLLVELARSDMGPDHVSGTSSSQPLSQAAQALTQAQVSEYSAFLFSPGMPWQFRFKLWLLCVAAVACGVVWELAFVSGKVPMMWMGVKKTKDTEQPGLRL